MPEPQGSVWPDPGCLCLNTRGYDAKCTKKRCTCSHINTFLEPKQEHVTTNYRSHKLHKDSESRVHKDTRSQKLELKKQNRLCLNTHICAWNFAHNLWKDLRTHFHFCLLSFLVAPFVHRAACASWPRGLGISRTSTLEGLTPPLGPVAVLDWDDSYSSKTEQPCTASYIGVLSTSDTL